MASRSGIGSLTPHALARQLHRLLPVDRLPRERPTSDPSPGAEGRILDAAFDLFVAHGVGPTTMSAIARETGISREWLYKHYRNRDAVVIALTTREVSRFIDGLAAEVTRYDDLEGMLTESVAFAVEFHRAHALLQRVIRHEPKILTSVLLDEGGSVLTTAVDVSVAYITSLAPLDATTATTLAETLVRLVLALVLAPYGRLDLQEPTTLRSFARTVVRGMLAEAGVPTSGSS